ncbi:Dolichyl-phosphate-mannose-protein mannosyltransferase [Tritrichomonas foetus]|uniref:Dolichyl-phosphate-mannose-protein mannosyltransferase n=1 Tax=Tritrichomonas foetus TaxID=1144522 RepID=A0A1J4KHW6_9EUKA|nr:Dolichyl-phosphate-mannose-protein mannosyltransferase [Tritrichomonas foetus]|eukprot:OHT09246.1 Dolichyl-phosphate-mannose-protein mannosyltransferase [Tritrichomonas foetus]
MYESETLDKLENIEIHDHNILIEDNSDREYQILNSNTDDQNTKKYNFIGVKTIRFTHADMLILVFLTFFSFWLHNFLIQFPDKPVFDEAHFGSFTNFYVHGEYFTDIHPPLGKLILFVFAKLNQYDGNTNFRNNSIPYPNVDYVGLRQAPALFSTFCSPLIYVAMRCFGFSIIASFTAGLMVMCDSSMIVEGRFILTDGILHFFTCLAILSTSAVLTQIPYTPEWWLSLVFNGFSVGCAVSTKYTSLSLCPFVGLIHFIQLLEIHQDMISEMTFDNIKRYFNEFLDSIGHESDRNSIDSNSFSKKSFQIPAFLQKCIRFCQKLFEFFFQIVKKEFIIDLLIRGLVLIFMIILVFFTTFSLHFIFLPYQGSHDTWVSNSFSKSLIRKGTPRKDWGPRTKDQNIFKNIIQLNKKMHKANMRISASHPYASKWFTWPFLTGRWVLFYSDGPRHIMCMGQVVNVYCGTLSVIFVCLFFFVVLFYKKLDWNLKIKYWLPASFAFGYCASYFPFSLIKRAAFFYHYIIPIIFGIITFVATVENLLYKHQTMKAFILVYAQIFTVLAFFFWAPWTYGYPMEDFDVRLWYYKWQRD